MREGQRGFVEKRRRSLRLGVGTVMIIFGAPEDAATLILRASSAAIWLEAAQGGVLRLRDEIERAERKRFQRERSAFLGVRADDDYRHAMLARDLAQHLDAVHARHFEIERHDVRMQLFDLAQADQAVHRRADDFDGGSRAASAESASASARSRRPRGRESFGSCGGSQRRDSGKMRNHRRNIQNQHDRAIAEDRSAAHQGRRDELIFERFDHQFFLAHQAVDREPEPAASGADDDHEEALGCGR